MIYLLIATFKFEHEKTIKVKINSLYMIVTRSSEQTYDLVATCII
jgi:hypothetical protein